jgi:hypothetical protein
MGDENTIVLRTAEFYGRKVIPHMLPKQEAIEESERMMNVYADFAEDLWLSQL